MKNKEFWNSYLTEKSWKILQEFRKKYDFILIGGWAIWLWTKQQKSKDVDIVVSIKELQKLKSENMSKNNRLKKYEVKEGEIDIDIYVEHFSELTISPEKLKNYSEKVEGFKVASPESLLILKQGAYKDRKNSVKGEKDLIDILSILFFSDINLNKYSSILKDNSLSNYIKDLIVIVRNFKDYNSLKLTLREFKLKKEELIKELRRL